MKRCWQLVWLIVGLGLAEVAIAYAAPMSLDIKNANVVDVLRLMGKFLDINMIMSPAIEGVTTIHLHNAPPTEAMNMLLAANGLAKWQMGRIWFVAPQSELIRHKQDEAKWQSAIESAAPLQTRYWQINYGKAEELAKLMQGARASLLSARGHVHVDTRTNILYVQDVVARLEAADRMIHALDIPVQQILVEVRLASVDNDFERELGVNFSVKGANVPTLQEIGRYSVVVATLADGSLLDVKLSALENAGHAELISSPRLFTANQQSASIEAGEEVPYQEVSESGGTAVRFKKAVLGLKVTPQILPGNKVLLTLHINQDRPSAHLVQGVPTINTRQITTNVLVSNKQTVVLGGIYENNQERGQHRLPLISDVPVIGHLFKQQHQRENKRELLIFVTPKIMTQTV